LKAGVLQCGKFHLDVRLINSVFDVLIFNILSTAHQQHIEALETSKLDQSVSRPVDKAQVQIYKTTNSIDGLLIIIRYRSS
jgi:hypothetical protein